MAANDELRSMWKEAVVDYFKVLSRCVPTVTEESQEKPHLIYSVSKPRSELGMMILSFYLKHF